MSLPPGKLGIRGHAATTCNVDCRRDGRVSSIASASDRAPQDKLLRARLQRRGDRASGRPRSRCVVRRVSPHTAHLVDDDERCRVSVCSARVGVRPWFCESRPHRYRNELAAGTAGHVPLPTFRREQSRWNTVWAAPLEQAVSGCRPKRQTGVGRGLEGPCLSRARGRTF